MFPNLLQLLEEDLIVLNVPKLIRVLVVTLKVPIRRGSHNEMHGLVLQEGQVPGVAVD
jgi:hypothetical protein